MTSFVLLVSLAAVSSLVLVGGLRYWLYNRWMDIPNERSSHTSPTPRGGGLGFIVGFAIAGLVANQVAPSLLVAMQPGIWWSLVPLVAIGLIDDWRTVPAGIRYVVQLSVALAVVSMCGGLPVPGMAVLGEAGDWLAFALNVIGVTALINVYNFMDGLDGLVAGVTAVQLSFLALWYPLPVLWLGVAALLGFLVWNWSPAKIFMGDAGSTVLGAVMATALISPSVPPEESWLAAAILLPLVGDAVYTLGRRLVQGENIFQAHRTHLYQRLHQLGWSHSTVAGLYIASTGLMALGLWQSGAWAAWLGLIATVIALVVGNRYVLKRGQERQQPVV